MSEDRESDSLDNASAAQKWRLHQARKMMKQIVKVEPDTDADDVCDTTDQPEE